MKQGIITIFLTVFSVLYAWGDAVGTWKVYPSYSDITDIQPAGKQIFVLASNSLYSYNINDGSLQTYSKNDVLNSSNIQNIAWVGAARKLIITYSDYTIDILTLNGDVEYISALADKQTTDDKTINSVYVSGQYAYLSTGFGIVKINAKDATVADTYNLGFKVDYCYISSGYLYAASESKGLMRCALTANLLNRNEWTEAGNYTKQEKEKYVFDSTNKCYWGADAEGRLTKYQKLEDGSYEAASLGVMPDGPACNSFWRLYKHDGKLFGTAGLMAAGMYIENPGIVNIYDPSSDTWSKLEEPSSDLSSIPYKMVNCMTFDPKDNSHFWVGGYSGLYEYRNYKCVNAYNYTNSTLVPIYNTSTTGSIICSMTYDPSGNLWVMNGWCDTPVQCLKANGEWKSYPMDGYNFDNLNTIDYQGIYYSNTNKSMWWIHSYHRDGRIFRMTDEGNIKAISQLQYNYGDNESAKTFSPTNIYDIEEDHLGNIWFATTDGPVFLMKDSISANSYILAKHKVPRGDGKADLLLDGIALHSIAIDAANQKWMGTKDNGVYLIGADNNTQIHHFTKDDSPLISNTVLDILIDEQDGTVYFATDKGLCSFKGDITADNLNMSDETVWAYPNPMTPDFTGDITIRGLEPGSQIIITTTSGHKVAEGVCSGGSYLWNGCDLNGKKVASGVYMVNVATRDGNEGVVTKIAIVR